MLNVDIKLIVLFAILSLPHVSLCQKEIVNGQEVETIFRIEDSPENFYLVLKPKKAAKGLLVILPGFGGWPKDVLNETDLPVKARDNGYLVVIPFLAAQTFYTDSLSQSRLTTLVPEVIEKYNIPKNKFVIGGHSAGGNGALLYAERAFQLNSDLIVKPNLVFGVDPPLDMKRLWDSFEHIKQVGFSKTAADEADYFLDRFNKELGGTPAQKPNEYEKISSYYKDAKDGGKIKYLKDIPVRLYCHPDIQWYIDNRRQSYEDINAFDLSACIVQLRLLGNAKAELITSLGKGYLPGRVRHPHAFSQLDADEFLAWINKVFFEK